MKNNRARRGFTLIEIMIVVLIIGILMAIAVPNYLHARNSSRLATILSNLRQIEHAKEQLSMANGLQIGASISSSDISPTFLKSWPASNMPIAGDYLPNAVGTTATFSGNDYDWWELHCQTTPDSSCPL